MYTGKRILSFILASVFLTGSVLQGVQPVTAEETENNISYADGITGSEYVIAGENKETYYSEDKSIRMDYVAQEDME